MGFCEVLCWMPCHGLIRKAVSSDDGWPPDDESIQSHNKTRDPDFEKVQPGAASTCASGSAGGFTFCLASSRWTATQPRKQRSWFTCAGAARKDRSSRTETGSHFFPGHPLSPQRAIVPSSHRPRPSASQHRSIEPPIGATQPPSPSPATRAARACRARRHARDPSLESCHGQSHTRHPTETNVDVYPVCPSAVDMGAALPAGNPMAAKGPGKAPGRGSPASATSPCSTQAPSPHVPGPVDAGDAALLDALITCPAVPLPWSTSRYRVWLIETRSATAAGSGRRSRVRPGVTRQPWGRHALPLSTYRHSSQPAVADSICCPLVVAIATLPPR